MRASPAVPNLTLSFVRSAGRFLELVSEESFCGNYVSDGSVIKVMTSLLETRTNGDVSIEMRQIRDKSGQRMTGRILTAGCLRGPCARNRVSASAATDEGVEVWA